MRIAMFLDQSFPPDSRVENEAYSLIKAGHEVHLFSLSYQKVKLKREEVNGIEVHRYKAGKLTYKLSALAYTFPFFHNLIRKKISGFLSEVQPDAIHVHDMLIAQAVMDVNSKSDRPLYLTLDLHEDRPEIMQFYPHLKKMPGKFLINIDTWRKKQMELIRRADKVVLVTNEAVDRAVISTGEDRSKFISLPNTIEKDIYFNYAIDKRITRKLKRGFDIVYVGDTGLRRGTDTAIRALRLLIEKVPQAQLILVGKSTEDIHLVKLVEELGVSAHVIFEGWQDVSLFPSYISGAEVCISPLHRNLHHDTTYANKIFQYMAGERPLVVSDCAAQANIVRAAECGLVFEAGNAQSMTSCLLELYNNPSEARRMGENGLLAVQEQYHWKKTSQALISFYQELDARQALS
ncbi:MAG: glycosyltransferase family 4 protein [Roseivirga sp.]|nr:glycosyltransferase family 4 protein [Roseivirga sp.]